MMMKLSEAVRLGAMATPKADGVFYDWRTGATCAQGAALLAIGQLQRVGNKANHEQMVAAWPWIKTTRANCPSCGKLERVRWLIHHLNNEFGQQTGGHGWRRHRIAGWIATLEPPGAEAYQT